MLKNFRHEGRVWYSEHRGRLWIASTAKEPRHEEIQELENFYKQYYNGKVYVITQLLNEITLKNMIFQKPFHRFLYELIAFY